MGLWGQVAWIKADTKAVLAIHEHVITNNARLSVTHSDYNTWTLNIRGVRREDRGIYMCQVNTDPMKSQVRDLSLANSEYTIRRGDGEGGGWKQEKKMAVEVENLFTLDPGQIFIVRDAFAWRAFISKWNPVLSWERCVFRLCVPNKKGGDGIKFRGVVFFSEIWVDLLECSLFHFFFSIFISLSLPIIVYYYTIIILY